MGSCVFTTSTDIERAARRCVLVILAAMFGVTWMVPAQAQIARSWNTGEGLWFDGSNWTPFGVPGTLDGAFIGNLPGIEMEAVFMQANDTVAGVSIQSGMTLILNGTLVVNGNTTISGSVGTPPFQEPSALWLAAAVGSNIGHVTNNLTLSDGAEVAIVNGLVQRVLGTYTIDPTSHLLSRSDSGNQNGGVVNLLAETGVAMVNDGTIENLNSSSLVINQIGAGLIDLDGGTGNGVVSNRLASNASITVNGTQLSDSFSGNIELGSGGTLTMNFSNGWTADNNSRISVNSSTFANLNGGNTNLGGDIVVGTNLASRFRVGATATFLPTADVELVTSQSEMELAGTTVINGGVFQLNPNTDLFSTGSTTVNGGVFNVGQGAMIDFNGPTTISGGTFNTFSTIISQGDVDFNGPTIWAGDVTINGVAQQQGNATVSATSVITADAFDMDGSSGNTPWDINARLEVHATRIDSGASVFNGTFDIGGPTAATLLVDLENSSQPEWEMAGTMNLSGVPIGFIDRVRGSRMIVTGQLNVQQRVDISADTTLAAASTTNIVASSHLLQLSGVTVVEPGATITGNGYLQNAASGNMLLPVGLSTGNVGLSNEGLLRLGDAVGVVAVAEFVQSSGATLVADVGRSTTSTDSDVLTISTSVAVVDGFVQPNIVNIGGTFQPPQIGNTFTILTAVGGVSGMFDAALDSNLGGQVFEWALIHNPNNVQIELTDIGGLPGDYNRNGVVDAPDYVIWRKYLGSQTLLAADGDWSGTVDEVDYDFWRNRFGNTLGIGSGSAVPEPCSLILSGWAAVCLLLVAFAYSRELAEGDASQSRFGRSTVVRWLCNPVVRVQLPHGHFFHQPPTAAG